MDIQIQIYSDQYKEKITKMFEDFQDFFLEKDPLKRMRRMPEYGKVTLQNALGEVEDKYGVFYVALHNTKVIGFVIGILEKQTEEDLLGYIPSKMGRVIELYVTSEYRAHGIGSKLLQATEEYFKQKECIYIWIEVFMPNINAHKFYKKLGYEDRNVEMIKKIL